MRLRERVRLAKEITVGLIELAAQGKAEDFRRVSLAAKLPRQWTEEMWRGLDALRETDGPEAVRRVGQELTREVEAEARRLRVRREAV